MATLTEAREILAQDERARAQEQARADRIKAAQQTLDAAALEAQKAAARKELTETDAALRDAWHKARRIAEDTGKRLELAQQKNAEAAHARDSAQQELNRWTNGRKRSLDRILGLDKPEPDHRPEWAVRSNSILGIVDGPGQLAGAWLSHFEHVTTAKRTDSDAVASALEPFRVLSASEFESKGLGRKIKSVISVFSRPVESTKMAGVTCNPGSDPRKRLTHYLGLKDSADNSTLYEACIERHEQIRSVRLEGTP